MLKMVDGTGIIGVDMICPLGVSTPQPPNYDRVELEGTGMLVLPNSLDAPLEMLELGGKTEQVQTTGKNVWDPNAYADFGLNENSANSIRFENDVVTYISDKGSYNQIALRIPIGKLQIGDYKVSFGRVTCKRKDTSKTESGTLGAFAFYKDGVLVTRSVTFSVDDPNADYSMTCSGFSAGNNGLLELSVENPMISQISVGTYEPYTGGKPSPSPEYPQEIKNVGKWNEETRKYEVDVKVTGKNLLDKRLLEGGEVVEFNGVECYKYIDNSYNFKYKGKFENGQQYAFTLRILRSASKESNITDMVIVYTDGSMKQMRFSHGELKTFVSDNGKTIDYFSGAHNFSVDCYLDLSVTRLSVGGQDAGYDPYKEQTLTLTSDRPLTKWDRLVEQGGEIGWLYQSEIDADVRPSRIDLFPYGFNLYKNHENGTHTYNVTNIKKAIGFQTSYCKQFKNKDAAYQSAEMRHYSDHPAIKTQYFNTDIPTREEFIEWMESNPLTMVFKTESATFVPLPQSEQNAIRALKTYYPTTVITVDGGELDPDIKVTYRKEI